MDKLVPFKAELLNERIILSGDMDQTSNVLEECKRIAKLAAGAGSRFVVDAQHAKLWVDGENAWKAAVQEFLGHCNLIYLPSSLAMNLEYDDKYQHGSSRFLDTDDESVE